MDKKTPFYSFHKQHNAKLISFAGYTMPIQYKGVTFEHHYVRDHVGVFDVSHMAQIILSGPHSFDFLQKITTNNVAKLFDGKVQYSCMLNANGGIIDDLLVYQINREKYMLVVNAANAEKNMTWITQQNDMKVNVENITQNRGLLAVQGPDSNKLLQKLTHIDLSQIPYYTFKIGEIANCSNVIISNTGYTGSGGFELYVDQSDASTLWEKLFLNNDTIEPIGLAARDTLRLEMGYCLYGNDIDESTTPIEAGLAWIVDINKNFIGRDIIAQQVAQGVERCLVGFCLQERGVPRKDYEIVNAQNKVIGQVTSGSMSPFLKRGIGMGYVSQKEGVLDNDIFIIIRNKKIRAKIVKKPFYEK